MKITADLLVRVVRCLQSDAEKYAANLGFACAAYSIDTPARLAAFLAQIGHESESFRYAREIWGPTPAQSRYEGREDLGNTQLGDGHRYCGRGLIQTTGRANYATVRDRLRLRFANVPDFEADPTALEQPLWATLSAADYWDRKSLNALADAGDFETITRRINGGLNGQADRLNRHARALAVLTPEPAAEPPPAAPAPAPTPASAPVDQYAQENAPMLPFLIPAISAIAEAAPRIAAMFGGGSEVSQRNLKAAVEIVNITKETLGVKNEQEVVETLRNDPTAAAKVREAIDSNWGRIDEIGGGIQAARVANVQQSNIDPKRNMALWVTAALLPLVYLVVARVLFSETFSQDVRAMVVAAVISGVLGAITGYWLGTSFSSAKKDEQKTAPGP